MKINNKLLLVFWIFLFAPSLYSLRLPSDKDYKEISSHHFTILYYSDKAKAKEIITVAQNVHNQLFHKFYINDIHTYIILLDITDLANGMATLLPDNIIIVYDVPPELLTQISLLNYYNWVEELIVHEYTHILHLNQAQDVFRLCQQLGIKYSSPNLLLPISSIEGLAVSMETIYTPMGRARSSYKDMILRTAIYEDNIPSIDEISTFLNKIPSGYGPYIWGGSFHYYLLDKISEKKVLEAYYDNAGCFSAIPGFFSSSCSASAWSVGTCFPLNGLVKNSSGISYYNHYDEWIETIKKQYKKEIIQIKQPTVPVVLKNIEGFWNIFNLACFKNNLYFSGYSPHTGYGIYKYNLKTMKMDIIIEDMLITKVIVKDDFLYFIGLKLYDNVNQYLTFYKYDLKTRDLEIFHNLKRVLDIALRGDKALIIQIKNNEKCVQIMNLKNGKLKPVLKLDKYDLAYDFSFNCDNEFYFIGKKKKDFIDIYHYNIKLEKLKRITHNSSIEMSLFYSEHEQKLYFVSDYNSRFNFYQYIINEKAFYRLTDFISGSMRFIKYNDKYYTVYYKSNGFIPAMLKENELQKVMVSYNEKTNFSNFFKSEKAIDYKPVEITDEKDFSIFGNFFTTVMPVFGYVSACGSYLGGFGVMFADVLMRNNLILQVDYNSNLKKWGGWLYFNMFRNKVDYNVSAASYYTGEIQDVARRDTIEGRLVYFKNKFINRIALHSGLSYYKLTEIDREHETYYNSFFTGFTFNNTKQYAYSIIPEKGWAYGITYRMMKEWLGSTYDMDLLFVNINKYYKTLFNHHILKLNFKGGALLNDLPEYPFEISGIDLFRLSSIYEIPLNAYSYYKSEGKNYFVFNASYNFPLFWVERGIKNMPLLLRHFWMNAYFQAGESFNTIDKLKPLKLIGSELHANFYCYYQIVLDVALGASLELEKRKDYYLYFKFSTRY